MTDAAGESLGECMVLREYAYFPEAMLSPAAHRFIDKYFRVTHFHEMTCRTKGAGRTECPHRKNRPTPTCEECPGMQRFNFPRKSTYKGQTMIGVPMGRKGPIKQIIAASRGFGNDGDGIKIIDARTESPMRHGLKFTGKLYDYQETAVAEMEKHYRGLVQSKPRTGKTVMMLALSLRKKEKTIILAHQDDLLIQFYNTILKLTNAQELIAQGKEPIGIIKDFKDHFRGWDIALTTYQKFIRPVGKERLKMIQDIYGCVMFDEAHRASADAYSATLSMCRPTFMFGCSATPERKDEKHFVVDTLVAPVRHTVKINTMVPTIKARPTVNRKLKKRSWNGIINEMAGNPKRNMAIVEQAVNDVQAGHHIVIPSERRWFCDAMAEEINKEWTARTGSHKKIAEPFYRQPKSIKKTELLNRARSGETKVVIAIRSMLLGIDVPRWSCLYEVFPISNAPNFEQEAERVCTPFEGKTSPVLRFFVDDKNEIVVRCFLNTMRHCRKLGYEMDGSAVEMDKRLVQELAAMDSKGGGSTIDLNKMSEGLLKE